ncbi:MAG: matrixin family metalloprotease [Nanoarchaeota archaeon]|nr:matrixin family metalloprotease [Nanoarchaeota archaeon]
MKIKKEYLFVFVVIAVLATASFGLAKPNFNKEKPFQLPEKAVEVAPNIFYLGEAFDNGKKVQGFAIINKKKDFGKPGTECGNGICEPGENAKNCPADCGSSNGGSGGDSSCYAVYAKGAIWKTTEPYLLDTTNNDGMNDSFVYNVIATSLETWDNEVSFDIFGTRTIGIIDGIDEIQPDGKNEVYFGDISYEGAIAVTIVWGIFGGPPKNRELVEWDQLYDHTDFDFGNADENPSIMDLQNIATHEDGHSLGLGHPSDTCTEETMYRFADYGETKKRTLNTGDIAGVNYLY